MNRPYPRPEKAPQIQVTEHGADVETRDERYNPLYRSVPDPTRHRHAEPYKRTLITSVVLLLVCLVAAISILQIRYLGDPVNFDGTRHHEPISSLFKRALVWNKSKDSDKPPPTVGLTGQDIAWRPPQGWAGREPFSELDKRSQGDGWKYPKGWKPIHDLDPEDEYSNTGA
ncbi:Spherulin-4 [Drechslerella dactyloides]|uniref:Spherulin-4 n=1 Tax=Drechslerella dactyloides TaxID=74499 RepID=A0AAD6J226_DREDA|nr:Spherulin-4 [Drechslerella dactyloides]